MGNVVVAETALHVATATTEITVREDRGVIADRVSCRRARPSDVTYTRVRGHHVAAAATA
jgi:hypothetical protein